MPATPMPGMTLSDAVAITREGSMFAGLTQGARAALFEAGTTRTLKRGQTLFREGDDGETMIVVLSGVLRVSVTSRTGKDIVLAYVAAGDAIGELSVFDRQPRSATAAAVETADLLSLTRRDLKAACAADPEIAWTFLEHLAHRLRRTNALIESGRGSMMGPRLARGLLTLIDEHGDANGSADGEGEEIGFKISQGDLGAYVALSRENVNRQLKEWEADGVITLAGGRIRVLDRDALEQTADFED